MKRIALLTLIASAMLVTTTISADKEEDKLKGIKCPVSGKPVVADKTVAYKEATLYFCCPGCPGAFKKDTAKYAAKANHQLFATKQAKEVKCPLTGGKLNPETVIEVANGKVCFCCNNCKGKASKVEGDKQIALIFNDKAFAKGFKVAKAKK